MKRHLIAIIIILPTLLLLACQTRTAPPVFPEPHTSFESLLSNFRHEALLEHVLQLSDSKLCGRRAGSSGELLAAMYIEEYLLQWGLEPWSELSLDSLRQQFKLRDEAGVSSNIVAVRRGLSDKWLLLVAHYDHLGKIGEELFPGADDNAVAVAIIMEIAHCFTLFEAPLKHNIAFIFTSAEENGLDGSHAFVQLLREKELHEHSWVINLDMLGGVGGDSLDIWPEAKNEGTLHLVKQAQESLQEIGIHSNIVQHRFGAVDSRSFAAVNIPSITLSWAYERKYHPHRHLSTDTPNTLQPKLMKRAAEGVLKIVSKLAN